MTVARLTSSDEYLKALREIEEISADEPSSEASARLEQLLDEVAAYEADLLGYDPKIMPY